MVVKKRKKTAKKKTSKKFKKTNKKLTRTSSKKINLVVKNLLTFAILTIASYLIQEVSSNQIADNLFILLTIIFGFASLTFLIVLLILLIMKCLKK